MIYCGGRPNEKPGKTPKIRPQMGGGVLTVGGRETGAIGPCFCLSPNEKKAPPATGGDRRCVNMLTLSCDNSIINLRHSHGLTETGQPCIFFLAAFGVNRVSVATYSVTLEAALFMAKTWDQYSPNPYAKTSEKIAHSLSVHKYRTAAEWQSMGVKVQHLTGDLPRAERETVLSFLDPDNFAEVSTARPQWMRRLESLGAVPLTITTFEVGDGEIRWYKFPRKWVKMPMNMGGSSNLPHLKNKAAMDVKPEADLELVAVGDE